MATSRRKDLGSSQNSRHGDVQPYQVPGMYYTSGKASVERPAYDEQSLCGWCCESCWETSLLPSDLSFRSYMAALDAEVARASVKGRVQGVGEEVSKTMHACTFWWPCQVSIGYSSWLCISVQAIYVSLIPQTKT